MPIPSLIAIDGPVAVGKSTVGRLLARRLGFRFVDTGVMYRALTWLALQRKVDIKDEETLSLLAKEAEIDLTLSSRGETVLVQGCDITRELRDPEVKSCVSLVSKVPGVRQALVAQQRLLAQGEKVVMVGRDIGTVVLPQAELKIFLLASPEERARRRYVERGEANYDATLAELKRRDEIDSQRSLSPLRPAPDAKTIDTEGLSPEQVVDRILDLVGKS